MKNGILFQKIKYASLFTFSSYFILSRGSNDTEQSHNVGTLALMACNFLVYIKKNKLLHNGIFFSSWNNSPLSLTFSCFNHANLPHLALNMAGLLSFGPILENELGSGHFLAFYLSSATFSSLFSQCYKRFRGIPMPSVGASGAIFSILGALISNPRISVAPIFFPFLSLPINTFFPLLMIFEFIELLRGRSMFDHAAHISGGLLGLFGTSWSRSIWEKIKKE